MELSKKTNQSGIVGVVGPLMGVAVDVVDVAPGWGCRAQISGHDQNLLRFWQMIKLVNATETYNTTLLKLSKDTTNSSNSLPTLPLGREAGWT